MNKFQSNLPGLTLKQSILKIHDELSSLYQALNAKHPVLTGTNLAQLFPQDTQ